MNDTTPEWPLWTADAEAVERTAAQEHGALALAAPCPTCGVPVPPQQRYCENCGTDVNPGVGGERPARPKDESTVKLGPPRSAPRACLECGGVVDADGYCETCGAKAPSERDHFEATPADWVAGVCDRGRVHPRNEDAMSLWAEQRQAALVVCDGVTSAPDSDRASLAAAQAAQAVLVEAVSAGETDLGAALVRATLAANQAVVALPTRDGAVAGSCTFAAAVLRDDQVHWAILGDSRIYAFVGASAVQLGTDDSVAEELIRAGSSRTEAESGPQAHAITRWLGPDAEDVTPQTGTLTVTEDGWLLVCSDGLWNYASDPSEMLAVLKEQEQNASDPARLSQSLVAWANAQGGRDNVTVALARLAANLKDADPPPAMPAADRSAADPAAQPEEKF